MNKCKVCGKEIDNKYITCYEHKDTKYKDICKIHGKSWFINGKCQKCEELTKKEYLVYKSGNEYFDKNLNLIDKNHFLFKYKEELAEKDKKKLKSNIKSITDGSGIYGIFVRDKRGYRDCGKCLYVGQSVSLKRRYNEHKENFKIAQKHILGKKAHNKKVVFKNMELKTELKYYKMAKKYKFSEIKFVCLKKLPTRDKEILTYYEQCMMDVYKPEYNKFAARP